MKVFSKYKNRLLWVIILLVFGAGVYANIRHAPFVFDDIRVITTNKAVHMTEMSWPQAKTAMIESKSGYRPFSNLTLGINYHFGGLDPFGYHLVNIGIHLLTGIFLFFFFYQTLLLAAPPNAGANSSQRSFTPLSIAGLSALMWLVHPAQTMAVSYTVQRMAAMSACFYVLAMLCYVRGRLAIRNSNRRRLSVLWFAGAMLAGVIALGSKQNAVMLPAFIILYEWIFLQGFTYRGLKKLALPGFLLLLVFLATAFLFTGGDPLTKITAMYRSQDFSAGERLFTEARVLIYYITLIAYPNPNRLNIDYDYPVSEALLDPATTIISIFGLLALLGCSFFAGKRYRVLTFGILWFLGNLVIESSVIGLALIYEHRLYLPGMMLFFSITMALNHIPGKRFLKLMPAALLIGLLCLGTIQRNNFWRQDTKLWRDCVQKSPGKGRPYQNLAYSLQNAGQYGEAIEYYKKSLELKQNRTSVFHNLGAALMAEKRYFEAIDYFKQAVQRNPKEAAYRFSLARAMEKTGQWQTAADQYRIALQCSPGHPEAKASLTKLEKFLKKYTTSIGRIKARLSKHSENPALYFKLGNILKSKNKLTEAALAYEKVIRNSPCSAYVIRKMAFLRLSDLKVKCGDFRTAQSYFKKALAIDPEDAMLYYNIALLHAALNEPEQTAIWLKKARRHGFSQWHLISNNPVFQKFKTTRFYKDMEIPAHINK